MMADLNKTEDKLQTTDLRTLWSETLVEMLCDAVKENWSDNAIEEIVKALFDKGMKTEQMIRILDRKLGPDAATRLARFVI